MRIPFDLMAAVLCIEGMANYIQSQPYFMVEVNGITRGFAITVWIGFFVITWLMNELITRESEWRTRFGYYPSGYKHRLHPLVVHTWMVRITQFLSVGLFTLALYITQWPELARKWPLLLGYPPDTMLGNLPLKYSSVIALPLNTAPYLISMLLSWLPRRRLASGLRGRKIPLLKYISYEARLTWLPIAMWLVVSFFTDLRAILPAQYTEWANTPLFDTLLTILLISFVSIIGLPKLIVWLWQCQPLPEGELKERLQALMKKSNVKARDILTWGPKSSGLLNACVLGVWSRYRYVLISPALVDELSMEETEAVLAHELGHARHGHLTFLFLMILCLSALLGPVLHLLPKSWHDSPIAQTAAAIGFVIAYIGLFYGALMRQCEREADLASAELMGTPVPLVTALEKLALITGNIRNIWCWHHGSIAERVDAVTRLHGSPDDGNRLHTRLRRVRIAFTVLTVLAVGLQLLGRYQ